MPVQVQGQTVAYIRVSSTDQNPARQVAAVGDVQETFTDRVSGGSRADEPSCGCPTSIVSVAGHLRGCLRSV